MNIYERMEEIIRDGQPSISGRILWSFLYDYDGIADEYYWKIINVDTEEFIFYTKEELEEYINSNWIKEGE